jgi:FeS assembly protein IscX
VRPACLPDSCPLGIRLLAGFPEFEGGWHGFCTLIARRLTMKWTDTLDIAIALAEHHPDVDPRYVRFTDLYRWVMELPDFSDDPNRSGEKILEAIQMAWIEEVD